mgnify:CR=1 FL=1
MENIDEDFLVEFILTVFHHDDVEKLMNDYFNEPVRVEAAPTGTPLENIIQNGYDVPNFNTKVNLLELLLSSNEAESLLPTVSQSHA